MFGRGRRNWWREVITNRSSLRGAKLDGGPESITTFPSSRFRIARFAPRNDEKETMHQKGIPHDRMLLRLLEPVDLFRVPQPSADGEGAGRRHRWRPILVGGVFNAVNPSVHNSREKPVPAKAPTQEGPAGLGAPLGFRMHYRPTVFPVNSVQAMRGCILLEPRASWCRSRWRRSRPIGATTRTSRRIRCCARSAGVGVDPTAVPRRHRAAGDQGQAARQHPGADRPRRLRLADHVRRRRRHVFRQRPHAADPRRGAAPEREGRRDAESRRLPRSSARPRACASKHFQACRWPRDSCASPSGPPGSTFPDILMAAGEYQLKPPLPFTPGVEAARRRGGGKWRRGRRHRRQGHRQDASRRLLRRGGHHACATR